jgi:trehalose 6-phosphate synthase
VVTALGGLLAHHDVTWVASAMTDEDRAVAAEQEGSFVEEAADGVSYRLRLVAHDLAAYERFYNVLANPTLWFLHHYMWGLGSAPDFGPELHEAWSDGYVPVNEALATAAVEELDREPDAAVLFHDYHLYLAPRLVREAHPDVATSHFLHIPWPEPDYWHALPPALRVAVHEGLLANDVVGFHTERWRRAFLLAAERIVGARVDPDNGTVEHAGHTTRVVAHPISVDPAEFDRLRVDPAVLEREEALVARRPEHLVLRVDRTDPSKNIVRGFLAFGLLLERHPELHGRVGMVALLAPSRQDIREYAEYVRAVEAAAREVNDRFGRDDWQPVELDIDDDFPRSVAGYKQFDVLLANPLFDGLNRVAKEAFIVN